MVFIWGRLFDCNTCLNHIQNHFDRIRHRIDSVLCVACYRIENRSHIETGSPQTLTFSFGNVTTISAENTSTIGQLSKIYKVCASKTLIYSLAIDSLFILVRWIYTRTLYSWCDVRRILVFLHIFRQHTCRWCFFLFCHWNIEATTFAF